MIEADGIVVHARGGRLLLDNVSLVLRPGTLTAVLGPNGAGKTTLLRVLAGELTPDAGRVAWDGRPVLEMDRLTLARRRAVLGQHQGLEFGLEVADVVALGRLPYARTPAARDDRAAVAAARDAFALDPFWRRRYPSLSGGERQRVQLARVAAQLWRPGPRGASGSLALFLDEPTAALDLAQQGVALQFARRAARAGAAVFVVLHDLNQAAKADQVILLVEGRVLAAGAVEDVLRRQTIETCFGVTVQEVPRPCGGIGFLFD